MASNDGAHEAGAAPVTQVPRRRRRRVVALLLLALPVAALLLFALVEIRIPLDTLRDRIERIAGDTTGLELRLEGPLYLVTGLRPGVELRNVVVAARNDGQSTRLLGVGLARAEIAPAALLDREMRVTQLHASDVELRFDAETFATVAAAERRAAARTHESTPGGWRFVEATRVEIVRARADVVLPALMRPLRIDAETLALGAEENRPLTIEARGSLAGEKLQIDFRTASLGQLRAGKRTIPLDLRFSLADASLTGNGVLDLATQRGEYRLAAKGSGRVIERLLPGFKSVLGELQVVDIEGRLRTAPDGTALESLTLTAGRTRARGELRQRSDHGRLQFQGTLDFEALDLRPWLPLFAGRKQAQGSNEDPLAAIRAVQRRADIDFGLKVETLIWPQREAHGVNATLQVGAAAVALRGAARLLVGAIEASARLETADAQARLRIDAQGDQIVLEALHPQVEQAGVSGVVRSAKLALRGAGANMPQLKRSFEGELDLRKVDAQWRRKNEGAATRVQIETAQLAATRETLRGTFQAAIDDATVVLKLASERAAVESAQRVVDSTFDLTLRRAKRRGMQFAARGVLLLGEDGWRVEMKDARLGRSRGSATAKGTWTGDSPLTLSAAFAQLDAAALEFFDFESVRRSTKPVPWEETPVLPSGVELPAADFDLSVARLEAAPLMFEGLRVAGRSRGGRLEQTQFELSARGGAVRGEVSADLRGSVPRLRARAQGTDFDARHLLERFGATLDRATARRFDAQLDLRGARMKQAVAQSTLQVSAQGVDAVMRGPLDAQRPLAFKGRLDAGSSEGQLSGTANGTLNGKPFRASSRGPRLATLIAGGERVPMDIDVSVAENAISVQGVVSKGPRAEVGIRLAAKRADALLALAGVEVNLPGALSASAQLKLTPPARYAFEQLDVRLGGSALSGRVVADGSARRGRIDAKLAGPELHLRDLGVDAAGFGAESVAVAKTDTAGPAVPAWIESLRRFDASLELQVERLFAAGELLGGLRAEAWLKGGRLHVGPLTLRQENSVLRTEGEVDVRSASPEYVLDADLRNYDLTPLLRSFEPSAQGTASFDARAALHSHGLGKAVVSNLSGAFDGASYGTGVGSGAIQMMGINLLGLVLNTLDRSRASKINCAVGVFDIEAGVMKSRALFVDTTQLRIMGNLDVDLSARTLDGGLRPSPKNPRLFNVATPIRISGTLDHPDVSMASSALPELLIRYSNPYTMFLGTLMETENAKADGRDDCRAAYARTAAARPEGRGEWRSLFRFLQ